MKKAGNQQDLDLGDLLADEEDDTALLVGDVHTIIPAIKPPPARHNPPAQPASQPILVSLNNDYSDEEGEELFKFPRPQEEDRYEDEEGKGKEREDESFRKDLINHGDGDGHDIERGFDHRPKNIMEETSSASFRRILSIAKPEFWFLLGGTLSLIVSSGTFLVLPAYAGQIIDAVSGGGRDQLNRAVISMCVIFVVGGVFTLFRSILFEMSGARVVARLRSQLFAAVIKQEVGFFDMNKTGELINRLSSDCEVLQAAVTVNISMGLRFSASVIGGIIILFVVSWKLTLVMLAVTPVVVIVAVAYGKSIKALAKERQDALAKATDSADESIANIRTVRSFSAEEFETKRFDDRVAISYRLAKKVAYSAGAFVGIMSIAASGSIVLVLWYGGTLVIDGYMSTGTLTSFILYTLTVAASLGGLSSLYGDFMKATGASSRVFQLLDRLPVGERISGERPKSLKGEITFEDVYFSYPARPDTDVLNGMSLNLHPGKVVALVGPSGAGKSTVTHLLEQFYLPQKGRIILDGADIRYIDPKFLRQKIGLVSQEPVLFATTIAENIRYGMTRDVSQEEIEQAARFANAHQFITEQQDGYNTLVGERGIQLSGGQKQRIAIARALLKDPLILLLDEATSALDAESEHLVQDALDRLMKGRTTLVIAHRLSTVQNADCVCVVEKGKVVEQGTHSELMALDGLYKQLVSRQLQQA